jgi:hypothetical protein
MAGLPLPTAVVGSYSMPGWLERAKNDYLRRGSPLTTSTRCTTPP